MVEEETLAESIRRKILENKVEALKGFSDCETTEISSSHGRPITLSLAVPAGLRTNPLLPVCLGLAITVFVLAMVLLMHSLH